MPLARVTVRTAFSSKLRGMLSSVHELGAKLVMAALSIPQRASGLQPWCNISGWTQQSSEGAVVLQHRHAAIAACGGS